MKENQVINKQHVNENARFTTAGRLVWAIFSLMVLTMLSLPSFGIQPITSKATQKLANSGRQVRITATSVAQLPANKPYIIDLKQKSVAYDFDPSGGRINYSRVIVRTATGDMPIANFIRKEFRDTDIREWETKRIRLTVLAPKNPARGGLGLKNPTKQTPFTCNPLWCACQGDNDCNDMFTTNVCGDTAFCVDTSSANVKCFCERP